MYSDSARDLRIALVGSLNEKLVYSFDEAEKTNIERVLMAKKSYKERRLARQAREQQKKDKLKTSEEARRERVQAL